MVTSVVNWRFVLKVVGLILIFEALFLFLSSMISLYYDDQDYKSLILSAIITFFSGGALVLLAGIKDRTHPTGKQDSYLSVFLSWFCFGLWGVLPYMLSGAIPNFTNAFFESVSGVTTTGASVLPDVEQLSHGLLFWRSLSQWLGGLGIIVFSLALTPILGGGASQLFDAETTGLSYDRFQPRISEVSKRLWLIYLGFTATLFILLFFSPMNTFDAVCHTLTTISTGGFSTKTASIAHWDSVYIETVIILFMTFGAINFTLFYFLFKGRFNKFFKDEELRWYIGIIVIVSGLICFLLLKDNIAEGIPASLRASVFHVISLFSTTGFSTTDYVLWGDKYWLIIIFLMIVCGCAGSTSGGLKTVRAVVLAKNTVAELTRLLNPRAIVPIRLNDKVVSNSIVQQLLAFAFLYVCIIFFSWLILVIAGMPIMEAFGAAVSGLSNTGPGLGENGPHGTYADIPAFAKYYLSFLMLVGRLEIFTVLTLFSSAFWKK